MKTSTALNQKKELVEILNLLVDAESRLFYLSCENHSFKPLNERLRELCEETSRIIETGNPDTVMLDVCVYKDNTGLYTKEEYEDDNLVDLYFPDYIVESWYALHKAEFDADTMRELCIPEESCDFNKWYSFICTADDFDGLCDYARGCGFEPERPE